MCSATFVILLNASWKRGKEREAEGRRGEERGGEGRGGGKGKIKGGVDKKEEEGRRS